MKSQKLFCSCLAVVLTLSASYPCLAQSREGDDLNLEAPFTPTSAATNTPSEDPAEAFTPTGAASSSTSGTSAAADGSSSAES